MTSTVPPLHVEDTGIDLYWLPLGAGGRSVRFNGRVYEAIASALAHRPARDLYHSALEVRVDATRYVIEMAPVWNDAAADRGAVVEGAVGARILGRFRWFRYEVRCWRDGHIPDIAEAVASPQPMTDDVETTRRVLSGVSAVPGLVWGRDQLGLGEMWNSNSLIAWLLAREDLLHHVMLPANGRAPGWDAGIRLAARQAGIAPRVSVG